MPSLSSSAPSGGGGVSLTSSKSLRGFHISLHSPLFVVLVIVFLHSAAVALVITPLTDLVADVVYNGNLQQAALFLSLIECLVALLQFVFDPIWGHMSDSALGRKPFMLLAVFEFSIELFLLYAIPSWWTLLLLGIARGVCGVGFTICSILILDVSGSHPVLAPRYLGYYGAASGMGLVFGSILGVVIGGAYGLKYPFLVGGIIELANAMWVILALPAEKIVSEPERFPREFISLNEDDILVAAAVNESDAEDEEEEKFVDEQQHDDGEQDEAVQAARAEASMYDSNPSTPSSQFSSQSSFNSEFTSYNPFYSLRILYSTPTLLWTSFAFFLAFLARAYIRIFFLYTKYQFGWNMEYGGLFLAYLGVLSIIVQGALLGFVLKKLGEKWALYTSLTCNAAGALGYAFLPPGHEGAILIYVVTSVTCLGFILLPLLRAGMSREVRASTQGLIGGAAASLVTAANFVGSIAYGPLFAYWTGGGISIADPNHSGGSHETMPDLKGAPFLFPGAPFFFSFLMLLACFPVVSQAIAAREESQAKHREAQAKRKRVLSDLGNSERQYQEAASLLEQEGVREL